MKTNVFIRTVKEQRMIRPPGNQYITKIISTIFEVCRKLLNDFFTKYFLTMVCRKSLEEDGDKSLLCWGRLYEKAAQI